MTAVDDRRRDGTAKMPTDVSARLGFFDRFATAVAGYASHAWFFAACLILVLVWAPTVIWFSIDTWQLIINTATTIVTFLLVALLQNTQTRADAAVQHKLNAIADALSDLMDQHAENYPDLRRDRAELRAAVGLEDRESA
ncbi:Low affinity iron permease [Micromonospora viridifaciens]|uniref:Low affinity iron permease n=1 Tax=Micromonospora viridifaciens TaxID=1881 RepID=A0A1C4Y8R4_MICVI|nr:low affinity iron permease family protein [Micromonospora viridifaciens]SCF17060.1 Low affinity iron permease [Micromonospora viridifaciens]